MKNKADRIKVAVPMEIMADQEGARFEQPLGCFDVQTVGDEKGIITLDEITRDILLSFPDGAACRIRLGELGNASVKSWGQWKAKKCVKGARR